MCTLDDGSGQVDVILLNNAVEKYQHLLENNRIIIVKGMVSLNHLNGKMKMIARELIDINQERKKYIHGLFISLNDQQMNYTLLNCLSLLLKKYRSGTIPVYLYYKTKNACAWLNFGSTWRVVPTDNLLNDLRKVIGNEQVQFIFN